MKVGALILGILGGLVSLSIGFIGYGLGSMTSGGGGLQLISIALPIVALIGAGIVMSKPVVGAGLMAAAAVGLILVLGFNFFSLVPVILLGLGALLGFMESQANTGTA